MKSIVHLALHLSHRAGEFAATAAGAIVVLLVAADRVSLGRHYPSDGLGGLVLGFCITCTAAATMGIGRSPVTLHQHAPSPPLMPTAGPQPAHAILANPSGFHNAPGRKCRGVTEPKPQAP